jgi:hypothetical protein
LSRDAKKLSQMRPKKGQKRQKTHVMSKKRGGKKEVVSVSRGRKAIAALAHNQSWTIFLTSHGSGGPRNGVSCFCGTCVLANQIRVFSKSAQNACIQGVDHVKG